MENATTTVTAGDLETAQEIIKRIREGHDVFHLIFAHEENHGPLREALATFIARERELALMAVAKKLCFGCRKDHPRFYRARLDQPDKSRWLHEFDDAQGSKLSSCSATSVFEVMEEWDKPHEHTDRCFASILRADIRPSTIPLCGHSEGRNLHTEMLTTS